MTQSKKSNLHEDLQFGSYPPRPSVNKMTSKFYTEEHDICDGQVKLLRTKQSGKVWQMRCWISSEKKNFKKSLQTKDLGLARTKGRKLYYSKINVIKAIRFASVNQLHKNITIVAFLITALIIHKKDHTIYNGTNIHITGSNTVYVKTALEPTNNIHPTTSHQKANGLNL